MYEKLPADIADRHVLLLDPILATGNSADKAIDVLLSKGVPQDRLLFLTLICAPQGIAKICSKYPKVTFEEDRVATGQAMQQQTPTRRQWGALGYKTITSKQ